MKQESILKGTLILTISGLFNRGLGFILRVYLAHTLGDQGLGLFQMVLPLFFTFTLLATAGFPQALAKIIPEKLAENKVSSVFRLFNSTLVFTIFTGLIGAVILYLSADFFTTFFFNNDRVYPALLSLVPLVFICPISSALNGFFQGCQTMKPTAIARTTEQINRFIVTIVLMSLWTGLEVKYRAAIPGLGMFIGELTGLFLLFFLFYREKSLITSKNHSEKIRPEKCSFFSSFLTLGRFALPVTSGRLIHSLMQTGRAVLIPAQLQKSGLESSRAAAIYGQLGGMVQQVILLPTVFTLSFTTSLIPSLSRAYSQNKLEYIKNKYRDIIRFVTYLSFPLCSLFFLYGREICSLLFSHPEAGEILSGLAFSAPFIYYLQVSSGLLKSIGHPGLGLRNLALGCLFQLTGIYFLVEIPSLRIQGALLSLTLGYILSAGLNYLTLGEKIGFPSNYSLLYLKPLLNSGLLFFVNLLPLRFLLTYFNLRAEGFFLLVLLFFNLLLYFWLMYISNTIQKSDLHKVNIL